MGGSAYGVWGKSNTGYGVVGTSAGASGSGVNGSASGASAYGGYFTSGYRAGYFRSSSTSLYSLYVDTAGGPTQATSGLDVNGSIRAEGNLFVSGSKAGYVVDEMQNADSVNLEPGDVVIIAEDSSAPVLGKIPVPRIKLAASPNDTAVVGVVDQVMYVPDASIRAAYEAQQQADGAAANRTLDDIENKRVPMTNIQNRISDEAGTLHDDPNAASANPNGYCSVVTLGAYKAVKADASFGSIRAGDLLTTSSHAGYAMRVSDKAAASGAIIGKALSGLASGSGTVTVLVTLK